MGQKNCRLWFWTILAPSLFFFLSLPLFLTCHMIKITFSRINVRLFIFSAPSANKNEEKRKEKEEFHIKDDETSSLLLPTQRKNPSSVWTKLYFIFNAFDFCSFFTTPPGHYQNEIVWGGEGGRRRKRIRGKENNTPTIHSRFTLQVLIVKRKKRKNIFLPCHPL